MLARNFEAVKENLARETIDVGVINEWLESLENNHQRDSLSWDVPPLACAAAVQYFRDAMGHESVVFTGLRMNPL